MKIESDTWKSICTLDRVPASLVLGVVLLVDTFPLWPFIKTCDFTCASMHMCKCRDRNNKWDQELKVILMLNMWLFLKSKEEIKYFRGTPCIEICPLSFLEGQPLTLILNSTNYLLLLGKSHCLLFWEKSHCLLTGLESYCLLPSGNNALSTPKFWASQWSCCPGKWVEMATLNPWVEKHF